jgi:hypothetical protein
MRLEELQHVQSVIQLTAPRWPMHNTQFESGVFTAVMVFPRVSQSSLHHALYRLRFASRIPRCEVEQ